MSRFGPGFPGHGTPVDVDPDLIHRNPVGPRNLNIEHALVTAIGLPRPSFVQSNLEPWTRAPGQLTCPDRLQKSASVKEGAAFPGVSHVVSGQSHALGG